MTICRRAEQRLLLVGGLVAALLVYQLVTTLAAQIWDLPHAAHISILCIAILLLLLTLAAFTFRTAGFASKPARLVASSAVLISPQEARLPSLQ